MRKATNLQHLVPLLKILHVVITNLYKRNIKEKKILGKGIIFINNHDNRNSEIIIKLNFS